MHTFYLDPGQLEDLTFCVYGRPIAMIDTVPGQDYCYAVEGSRESTDSYALKNATLDGYLSSRDYGLVLQDIAHKGLIMAGIYCVKVFASS